MNKKKKTLRYRGKSSDFTSFDDSLRDRTGIKEKIRERINFVEFVFFNYFFSRINDEKNLMDWRNRDTDYKSGKTSYYQIFSSLFSFTHRTVTVFLFVNEENSAANDRL